MVADDQAEVFLDSTFVSILVKQAHAVGCAIVEYVKGDGCLDGAGALAQVAGGKPERQH